MKRKTVLLATVAALASLSACDVIDTVNQLAPADEQVASTPALATIPGPGPVGTVLREGDTFGVIIGDTSPGWEDRCSNVLHGSPTLVARGAVVPVAPGDGYDLIPFCLKATSTG